jgi:WD40 repeat protein
LLSSSGDGTLRSWPLSGFLEEETKIIFGNKPKPTLLYFETDSQNRHIAICDFKRGIFLIGKPYGTELRKLQGYSASAQFVAAAFSPSGRLVAAGPWSSPKEDKVIRIWDLQSNQQQVLSPLNGAGEGTSGGIIGIEFLDETQILVSGFAGLQLFNILKNSKTILSTKPYGPMAISRNRRFVIVRSCVSLTDPCDIERIDLQSNQRTVLKSFGKGGALALDPADRFLVTSGEGLIRIGRISDEQPHIVFAHDVPVRSVAVSPDGRWIASVGMDAKIRLTPVPDLAKPAPHTLPYDQFLAKLKSFTNLRAVPDPASSNGWKLEVGPFPGWEKVPEW